MAGAGLLALLDDIATVLDDVALMTKMAAKKTAGVLGDDLALNAQQVSGVASERELPVVWKVAKGSLINKLILIPAALLLSAFLPSLVNVLLMIGGAYLCFEGAEKLLHSFLHKANDCEEEQGACDTAPDADEGECSVQDIAAFENEKIRGAVRTDFVLSAEIIVIALGTVPDGSSFWVRAAVICLIGLVMTVGVYGLVAGIVKMDDAGFALMRKNKEGGAAHRFGSLLVNSSPALMRLLGIAGTVAMFTVGGGILAHGLPFFHTVTEALAGLPAAGVLDFAATALFGVLAGSVLALLFMGGRKAYALCRR